jgi:hypothetical protein
MSSTFVRQDFYIQPPKKDSSVEAWETWMAADRKEAIKAKRAFTKAQESCDLPESAQESSMRRVNGVWKQTTAIAFIGSIESGSLEPTVEATQELDYIRARFEVRQHGEQNLKTRGDKRREKKARRKARK